MTTFAIFLALAGVIFVVLELITTNLVFIMLALGCVAGLIVEFFGAPLWIVVVVIVVIAAAGLLFLRPPLLTRLHRGAELKSGAEGLVGAQGRVEQAVTADTGLVQARGETWTARLESPASHASIPEGTLVVVTGIDGVTVLVRRKPSN